VWVAINGYDAKRDEYSVLWEGGTTTNELRGPFEQDCPVWVADWWALQPVDTRPKASRARASPTLKRARSTPSCTAAAKRPRRSPTQERRNAASQPSPTPPSSHASPPSDRGTPSRNAKSSAAKTAKRSPVCRCGVAEPPQAPPAPPTHPPLMTDHKALVALYHLESLVLKTADIAARLEGLLAKATRSPLARGASAPARAPPEAEPPYTPPPAVQTRREQWRECPQSPPHRDSVDLTQRSSPVPIVLD